MSENETARYRIGDVAQRAGVSTRTLRYYQELGLIDPAGATPGGNRLYSDADVARLQRILELRTVMGFDLDRISSIIRAEARLADLREEAAHDPSTERRQELIREAIDINDRLRTQVREKMATLQAFLDDLEAKATRYREAAAEAEAELRATTR